jgi:NTP pyrophosphatase (non-canonical NTP hydrolase)
MKSKIDDEDLFHAAIKNFGVESQIEMIKEECLELALALQKAKRKSNTKEEKEEKYDNIIDEIADVSIMIQQARMLFDSNKIDERIEFKLERLRK